MVRKWLGAVSALLVTVFPISQVPAQTQTPPRPSTGPSFSCAAGQGVIEQTVCGSPTLSSADREMATLYTASRTSAFGTGQSNELPAQRRTLKDMQACAKQTGKDGIADCLRTSYDVRSGELAAAVVLRSPELTLPVLHRTDPVYAPVLEAIRIWAFEPQDANWSAPERSVKRARILALITPTLNGILTKDDEYYAKGILGEAGSDGIVIDQVADALKSDRHFAEYLNVLGSVLPDDGNAVGDRVIPCAAVVRHPKLLGATGSIFGSTMDNTVLGTDCEETLPATPALTALTGKLMKAWPQCDGTIRFAAYRTYSVSVDAARLGITTHDPKPAPRRRGVTAADIAAARAELAARYAQNLGKSQAVADAMAGDAIKAVLNTAQECE